MPCSSSAWGGHPHIPCTSPWAPTPATCVPVRAVPCPCSCIGLVRARKLSLLWLLALTLGYLPACPCTGLSMLCPCSGRPIELADLSRAEITTPACCGHESCTPPTCHCAGRDREARHLRPAPRPPRRRAQGDGRRRDQGPQRRTNSTPPSLLLPLHPPTPPHPTPPRIHPPAPPTALPPAPRQARCHSPAPPAAAAVAGLLQRPAQGGGRGGGLGPQDHHAQGALLSAVRARGGCVRGRVGRRRPRRRPRRGPKRRPRRRPRRAGRAGRRHSPSPLARSHSPSRLGRSRRSPTSSRTLWARRA